MALAAGGSFTLKFKKVSKLRWVWVSASLPVPAFIAVTESVLL